MHTYCTLKFVLTVDNDAFSRHCRVVNMPFNKNRILIKNQYFLKVYTT